MKRDTKIILGLALVAFIAIGISGLGLSIWGAGELNLTTKSLVIDGEIKDGAGMQVISWDPDGALTPFQKYGTWCYSGYLYPTLRFSVGNLRQVGTEPYDVFNVTTETSEQIKIDAFTIWEYAFDVWITASAKADVVKGQRSGYEGRFAVESPWQGKEFDFRATAMISIEPYKFNDPELGYGIMWIQISDLERKENDPNLPVTRTLVKYAPRCTIGNVGEIWGSKYSANELLGKNIPSIAEITIAGNYLAGSYCYYDPGYLIDIIPGDLYQIHPIQPELKVTVKVLIGGHKLYIFDQPVSEPIEEVQAPPPIPPGIDLILLIIVGVFVLLALIFAAPRLIKASK